LDFIPVAILGEISLQPNWVGPQVSEEFREMPKNLQRRLILLTPYVFLSCLVFVNACSSARAPIASIATHQTPTEPAALADARLAGQLVLVGSCLFVREAVNSKLIHLSWPEGFSSNEAHDILDESGKTVARIDEIVVLGGGGSDWSNIDTVASDAKECRQLPTFVIDRILAG
jgi:hypothetical protein